MGARKTSISGASSYRQIGEFWDEHDLGDYWDQTHDVHIDCGEIADKERIAATDALFVMYDKEERRKS